MYTYVCMYVCMYVWCEPLIFFFCRNIESYVDMQYTAGDTARSTSAAAAGTAGVAEGAAEAEAAGAGGGQEAAGGEGHTRGRGGGHGGRAGSGGRVFVVNGRKLFVRGGNYICSDFLLRQPPARVSLDRAVIEL